MDEQRKLLIVIIFRFLLVTLIFVGGMLLRQEQTIIYWPFVAAGYGLSALYLWLWKHSQRTELLYNNQFYTDILFVSLLVLFSGGIDSLFVPFYLLIIVYSSLLRGGEGGTLALALSIISYTAIVNVGVLVPLGTSPGNPSDMMYRISLTILGLVSVAVLGIFLSERLHRTRLHLGLTKGSLLAFQAQYQNIVNSIRSGLLTLDLKGRITSLNQAAQEISGCTERELFEQPLSAIFPETVLEQILSCDFQSNLRPVRIEFDMETRDGRSVFIGMSCSPLSSENEERIGYVVSFRDLTEIKELKETVQFKEKMAAIGELAAGLAHEIRNPLASMSGSIQILRSELQLSDEQARLAEIVLRESERLNKILENFLVYANPPSTVSLQPTDLLSLVQDAVELLKNGPDFKKESHTIKISPHNGPVRCMGNSDQLRQVVWNILNNGLRAMPGGGSLSIELTREDSRALLSFRDEGVGMTLEERKKLFQPFHSGFRKGVGLGMAIVYQIIHQHKGQIDVNSRPGEGTVVSIWLPTSKDQEGPGQTEPIRMAASL